MAETNDFLQTAEPSVDEFMEGSASEQAGLNDATASTQAGYAAAMSGAAPEEAAKKYTQYKGELQAFGQSGEINQMKQKLSEEGMQKERVFLTSFLKDPEATDVQKKIALETYIDKLNGTYSLREGYAKEMLTKDSAGENAEQETVRINTGAVMREVNEVKRQKQALINSYQAQMDDNFGSLAYDVLESFVPFASNARTLDITQELDGEEGLTNAAQAIAWAGGHKEDILEKMRKMTPSEQLDFSRKLYDAITSNDNLVLPDDNDVQNLDLLRTFLEDGYYGEGDKWADNVFSLLDLTVIGGPLARVGGFLKTTRKATSVSSVAKDTNPQSARELHAAVVADESGEVAQAAYGTSRTEAIVDDLAPEIAAADGSVANKVGGLADFDLIERTKDKGRIYLEGEEKASATADVINDFKNPIGMTARPEMSTVGATDSGARISAVYGPTDGGYADASEAMDLAKQAFKDYGVDDEHIELLMKTGDKYIPVSKDLVAKWKQEGASPKNGFLVRVNYDYEINHADIDNWIDQDVKKNFFDRMGLSTKKSGSLTSSIFDPQSLLSNSITRGATVAVDRAAAIEKDLIEVANGYVDAYHRVGRGEMRDKLVNYLQEANLKGIKATPANMTAAGLDANAQKAVKAWRRYWDTQYYLENRERATLLRSQGYKMLRDDQGTRIAARPVQRYQVEEESIKYLDNNTGKILTMTPREVDEVYANGGTLARLPSPHTKGQDTATYVVSREDTSSYLRNLNNDDEVLAYREGYYSVQYEDPKFIVERVKDKSGKVVYERAVATAKNTDEADLAARRMASTSGRRYDNDDATADFFIRSDTKGKAIDDADYWSLQTVGGRSAQRIRGKRLESANGSNIVGMDLNMIDPDKLLQNSARSIANRAPMREYMESTKARFINQYKDIMPLDQWGNPRFPNSRDEIGRAGQKGTSKVADARTTFEYLRSLEEGYFNAIDDGTKAILTMLEDFFSEYVTKTKGPVRKALSVAEEGTRSSLIQNPTQKLKRSAFMLYLATNPLRQILVQGIQSLNILATDTGYVFSKRFLDDFSTMFRYSFHKNAKFTKEEKALIADWEASGLGAAVDRQNLVREGMENLADLSRGSDNTLARSGRGLKKAAGTALHQLRKQGFDRGERISMMANFLASRARLISEGRTGPAAMQEAAARARALTLNMNQAGDMPYNRNTLNLVFQFMQVPHKAITQILFNRSLSKAERLRLGAYYGAMFGLPASTLFFKAFPQFTPEDEETRDKIEKGMFPYALNAAMSGISGEKTDVDFSSLAPTDMEEMYELIHNLVTTDFGSMIAESPAGSLVLGDNPRVTNAFKTTMRWMGVGEFEGTPVEFAQVAKEVASTMSGASNLYKAHMAYETRKKFGTKGDLTDDHVSAAEAVAIAFGFSTSDEAASYALGKNIYEDSKAFDEDVDMWYKELKRTLAGQDITPSDNEYYSRMFQAAASAFTTNNRTRFLEKLKQNIKYDVEYGNDVSTYRNLLRASGFVKDRNEMEALINEARFNDPQAKEALRDLMDMNFNTSENE